MPPEIILASGSPRRHELLTKLGVKFEVVTADVDEHMPAETDDAQKLAVHNAVLKTCAVAKLRPNRWVLGADTIVVLDRRVLGKPASLDVARDYLAALSGHTHHVVTGCCLISPQVETTMFSDTSRVAFHALSNATIEKYLAAVHVLDKAGAYALQEHGDWIIAGVTGSRDNVLGLPTERLKEMFARRGLL
ncbi:MAG TPA: Maf family protein [Candidatus Methylacidiphilales bacterium]|jgi:septum formation protein|nr:Maf family protein [Candidatus Methylacidiphilales bacterium]